MFVLNFGLRAMHVSPKRPYFFRSLSPKDPHFYQLSPSDPLFLTNSLSLKDPDTSLSLKDPSFSLLIVKQVTIFGKKKKKKIKNFDLFFDAFHWKTPYFCAPCHWKIHFLTQFVTERPLHLRCLVALVRHFHMWVPPPPGARIVHFI